MSTTSIPKHESLGYLAHTLSCAQHDSVMAFPIPYSMAFQPIVDMDSHVIFAYEALVRGTSGESAHSILAMTNDSNRHALDQGFRVKAIEMASDLGMANMGASLSINFHPNAVSNADTCMRHTLETAARKNFPLDHLIFEVTESERVRDQEHLDSIIREYRSCGFRVAIDDFGAGYAGLNLLANFQPDILKIDRELTREIDARPASRIIIQAILSACHALGIQVIAEGVETSDEVMALRDLGIRYFQGFFFARPGFERLPW